MSQVSSMVAERATSSAGDAIARGSLFVADSPIASGANLTARALRAAATSWFIVAILGQWIFVAYVIGFYGSAAVRGRFEEWNKVLPHGYVAGDTVGNLVVSLHLLFAVVVIVGGALQLIPQVRRIAPAFHRWN